MLIFRGKSGGLINTLFFVKHFSLKIKETKFGKTFEIIVDFNNLLWFLLFIFCTLILTAFYEIPDHKINIQAMLKTFYLFIPISLVISIFYIIPSMKRITEFIDRKIKKYLRRK